ncbi:hypothetical protein P3T39_006012 [Kitasatospora sp. GP82]|nr:hypothetical protein [Kitasatospora sp. GP82]
MPPGPRSGMLPRDSGTIVQVGSAIAYRGIPLQSAYSCAKHALQGGHEALRCELLHAGTNVRCTMVQLPAVNTPQFDWVLSRLPRRAQPVPPIYQPELAARAVVYAADHPGRREYWVGGSTATTLVANAVVPGLLDRYLARTGFDSQQTTERRRRDEPTNLWEQVDMDEDYGAHGRFDDRAREHSVQAWASRHHGALAAQEDAEDRSQQQRDPERDASVGAEERHVYGVAVLENEDQQDQKHQREQGRADPRCAGAGTSRVVATPAPGIRSGESNSHRAPSPEGARQCKRQAPSSGWFSA